MKNKNIVSVCMVPVRFLKKASQRTLKLLVMGIASYPIKILIENLAKAITYSGRNEKTNGAMSFTPAIFKETINKNGEKGFWKTIEGWKEQQIFPFDFDGKITFKEAIARCFRFNLFPIFCYNSVSDKGTKETGYHKFRMIFMMPEPIDNIYVRNLIQSSLGQIFPERDKKCDEASHLFYGGQKIIYENYDARIDLHSVIHAVGILFKEKNTSNYSKKYRSYCEEAGLISSKGSPVIKVEEFKVDKALKKSSNNFAQVFVADESYKTPVNLYSYFRIYGKKVVKFSILMGEKSKSKKNKQNRFGVTLTPEKRSIELIDFDDISKRCRLFNDFISGTRKLGHQELFSLATNLIHIQGGETKFFEVLNSIEYYADKRYDFKYYVNYFKQNDYDPLTCGRDVENCSYHNQCNHAVNILSTSKTYRNRITVLAEKPRITVKEAEKRFKAAFDFALKAKDKKIYVIKAPTAIGKTEAYLNVKKVEIAVPTHILKNEISGRMNKKKIKHSTTPEFPVITDKGLKYYIDLLYQIGAYSSAKALLRSSADEYSEIKSYIENLDKASKSVETIVTTHERAMNLKNSNLKTLIFDEDPFQPILKICNVNLDDLINFLGFVINDDSANKENAKDLLKKIKSLSENTFVEMGNYNWVNIERNFSDWLIHKKIKSNVLSFLFSSFYIKINNKKNKKEEIHYIQRRELPDKKIIILSATANEEIYTKLYGDRLKFIDIGEVELKGKLIQYGDYSYSKSSLSYYEEIEGKKVKNEKRLHLIQSLVKDSPVITYKLFLEKFKGKFPKVIATFGSTVGLNAFSNMDISVVGTYHLPPVVYGLYALALGGKASFDDFGLEMFNYHPIEHNGFQFYFKTFSENLFLRTIQLHIIESELVQAIGRARLLRKKNTVTVYSNYPIQGAELRYLTDEQKESIQSYVELECEEDFDDDNEPDTQKAS